jgi:hypothetical protein
LGLTDTLLGVVVGVAASLVGWWIIARAVTPLISISEEISKVSASGRGHPTRYRFRYVSVRRWWLRRSPLVDVRVDATLRIRGTSGFWNIWTIPTNANAAWVETNRIVDLKVDLIEFKGVSAFSERLRAAASASPGDLEALLGMGEKGHVRVVISASHAYTGARRTFKRDYTSRAITTARFVPLTALRGTLSDVDVVDHSESEESAHSARVIAEPGERH